MNNKPILISGNHFIIIEQDQEIHELQLNGPKLRWAIDDFDNNSLRKRLKHTKLTKKEHELVTQIRKELCECLEEV